MLRPVFRARLIDDDLIRVDDESNPAFWLQIRLKRKAEEIEDDDQAIGSDKKPRIDDASVDDEEDVHVSPIVPDEKPEVHCSVCDCGDASWLCVRCSKRLCEGCLGSDRDAFEPDCSESKERQIRDLAKKLGLKLGLCIADHETLEEIEAKQLEKRRCHGCDHQNYTGCKMPRCESCGFRFCDGCRIVQIDGEVYCNPCFDIMQAKKSEMIDPSFVNVKSLRNRAIWPKE